MNMAMNEYLLVSLLLVLWVRVLKHRRKVSLKVSFWWITLLHRGLDLQTESQLYSPSNFRLQGNHNWSLVTSYFILIFDRLPQCYNSSFTYYPPLTILGCDCGALSSGHGTRCTHLSPAGCSRGCRLSLTLLLWPSQADLWSWALSQTRVYLGTWNPEPTDSRGWGHSSYPRAALCRHGSILCVCWFIHLVLTQRF